jgi:carbonic anhydrase
MMKIREPDKELTMSSSRREFLTVLGATVAGLTLASRNLTHAQSAPKAPAQPRSKPDGDAVLRDLLEGNERFVKGQLVGPRRRPEDFSSLAEGQYPEAIVVSCADSRVPPEILFDQGVGDLFVVRIAGNVVAGGGDVVKGSIEYGVAELGIPLIMVLGHSNCGAVKAAIKHIDAHDALPGAINGLVELIKPAVIKVQGKEGDQLDNAIRANVEDDVEQLKTLEPIVAKAVSQGKVKVVGATYDLQSGRVTVIS